jgi:hypothetical protein
MLLLGSADDDVFHTDKGCPSHFMIAQSTLRNWEDAPAFLRLKGILLYSKRPERVAMVFFCTSSGLTGI